jgi:hypothetical protein
MAEYERTVTVAADPDAAFAFLADPRNLPRYVATMVSAEAEESERVHVAAEVQGRHEEGDARLHVDRALRRMEWSGRHEGDYNGSLEVAAAGLGSSVTVHIHVAHEHDAAEVERTLDETAANIARLLAAA